MTPEQARELFNEHREPGDLAHYGEKAAVAAIIAATQPATLQEGEVRKDTVAFVQEWMMSGDHEPDQWCRDFAAAIDARRPTEQSIFDAINEDCGTDAAAWIIARLAAAASPTPPALPEDLRKAAQAVVDDYPVASGMYPSLEGTDGKPGYGSIRRLAAVLAQAVP